jgi:isoleucyl-tRNA synthetase
VVANLGKVGACPIKTTWKPSSMTTEIDYKDTLNLPNTDFPMKANLAQREPEILAKWQASGLYQKMLQRHDPAKSFLLNDGPPYANGDIHIGHALNKILKDIIVKSKSLSGYYAPFIPGWDCHGLPIELQVEKKIGKAGVKVDANIFRQKCREYASQQIDIQRTSFKRLGVFGDWDNPYSTMDFRFEANIIRTLGKIINNGHLARGDRPVHWCVDCGSALAEAEVEYADKTSDTVEVSFVALDTAKLESSFKFINNNKGNGPISIVIWTTTPWTLPANQAVAVNANLEYALAQFQDQRLIVAAERVKEDYVVLATTLGKNLEHILVQHPFYDRQVPIVLSDHVTLETGTGCVHIAPAHGNDDYLVGRKYNLPMENPVDANGCFYAQTPLFGGQHVFKANPAIIQVLTDNNRLLAHSKLTHSYPHCWRHKAPLIFRATQQWFVSMEKKGLRDSALAAIKTVQWIPQWGEARITNMISGRPDWCISRQRTWGTPLALLVHKETGDPHPRTAEIINKVALLVETGGIEAWFDLKIEDLIPEAEAKDYKKAPDTLDVWFDSGAIHACVADDRPEMTSPVDLYLEGSDQHRGWFQTSLLSSVAVKDQAPYKQVLTHGYVVDAQGRKMSKSLGNVIAPEKVIQTRGADVLRLWVAATDYRSEVHVSDEILKRTSDSYRRIRNTARFLLANLHDFDPEKDLVALEQMLSLDRWIVDQARQLQTVVLEAYEKYEFLIIYQRVHNFCSYELGSFYLDVIKDRQYTCKTDGIPRRSAQTALYYITEALVRWIAPILSFTAEEIWPNIPGKRSESVFLSDWYTDMPVLPTETIMGDAFWRKILLVRDEVNKVLETARKDASLGSGLEAEVILYCEADLLAELNKLKDELRFVLITSQAQVFALTEASPKAVTTDLPGLLVSVQRSECAKCARCWHRRADVDQNSAYPGICERCVENLSTLGETRVYA